jgi:hypothetical protein
MTATTYSRSDGKRIFGRRVIDNLLAFGQVYDYGITSIIEEQWTDTALLRFRTVPFECCLVTL